MSILKMAENTKKYHQQKSAKAEADLLHRPDWANHLHYGLPGNFDFSVVRTVDNATTLLCALPNSHRGEAAKGLYEHREIVGKRVAHRGLSDAWDHDHEEVIFAFGSEEALAAALRDVCPPSKRK